MNRTTLVATVATLFAAGGIRAAENNELDSNIQLFTVLAAINAAGFDTGLDSPLYEANPTPGSPNIAKLRIEIRKRLEAVRIPVLSEIRRVYLKNKPRHGEAQDFSQYVSLALSIAGPPDFNWKGRQVDMPPDALALEDFRLLLPEFYDQAEIGELWRRSQPAFNLMIDAYHSPVSKMAFEISSYFRTPLMGLMDRNFQIYVDALGPPNYVQARAYGNAYYVVVTPSLEPRIQDIRHSFLRFTVDPIGTKFGLKLMEKRSLLDIAVGAPALPDIYKNDFVLLATECLMKAVEARLDRNPQAVDTALADGFILTPFFFEQLHAYENQPQAMRLYFPDMIDAIDLEKETKRLQNVKFAATTQQKLAKEPPADARSALTATPAPTTPAGKMVNQAEDLYANKDYDKAKPLFLKSLELGGESSDHARAYYGLARIAALQKNPEMSERLFKKTLESSPDPQVKAWSLVYLGKLSDIAGDRAQARKNFEEALAVAGASKRARDEAQKGLDQLSKP